MKYYTLSRLIELNERYHREHGVKQVDVDKVNEWIDLIQNSRDINKPKTGDFVEYTNEQGEYYGSAHIESIDSDFLTICERPSIPFVSRGINGRVSTTSSGGAWSEIPTELVFIGKKQKRFQIWGSCGPTSNGAIIFEAEVNNWNYQEHDLEFTTKTHDKYIVRFQDGNSRYRWLVKKNGLIHRAFKSKVEYAAWLQTYSGVEQEGIYPNEKIVWALKESRSFIPLEEYKLIDSAITDSEFCNGVVQECKRIYEGTYIFTYLPFQEDKIVLPEAKSYMATYIK